MKKSYILLLLFTLFSIQSFAQGIIRGRIIDAKNSEPLTGASVIFKDTYNGTATDLNGNFQLASRSGTITLTVKYIGYEAKDFQVTVVDNQVVETIVTLNPSEVNLSAVLITGALQGQAKALNQQKTADNIKNVIAADQIGRFPDPNAAEAIQRIPGVSIERDQGEGRYVSVRGLSPQFTNMNINGEQISSPEADVRFVALDAIPADQLASIEINKSLTPDLDGDAIGGSVNLITRTAQTEKAAIGGSLVGGYNNLMQKPNLQGSLSYGQRFNNNKFGVLLNTSYYSNNLGSDNYERDLNGTSDPSDDILEFRDYELTRTRTGFSTTFDYKFNAKNEIYFKTLYTRFTDREWRRTYAFVPEDDEIERATKDRFEEQVVASYNFGGKHFINKLQLDYQFSFSDAFQDTPYDNEVNFIASEPSQVSFGTGVPTVVSPNYLNNSLYEFDQLEMGNTFARDQNYTGKIDLGLPYSIGGYEGLFKFGAKYRSKQKTFVINVDKFENLGGIPNLDQFEGGTLDNNFLNGGFTLAPNSDVTRVIEYFNANPDQFELQVEDKNIDEALEAFEATENVFAAYVMARQQIKRLLIVGGFRYESTTVTYNSKEAEIAVNGDLLGINPVTGGTTYDFLLPQFQLKYSLDENTNLRASGTYSYARPNFSEIIPAQEANLEDRALTLGNAELVPVSAINLDLLAERYFGNVGIISGGVFYKKLDNFIYNRTLFAQPYRNNPDLLVNITQAQNGNQANLLGLELAFQRSFSKLPGALKGLSLYANYTYTSSNADIQSRISDADNQDLRETITLPGQAAHVGNFSLNFEKNKFNARVSINFNGQYLQEVGETADFDLYVKRRMQVDANVNYALNKKFRIFGEFLNLTNQPFEAFQGNKDITVQTEFYSFWTRVGLKFDL